GHRDLDAGGGDLVAEPVRQLHREGRADDRRGDAVGRLLDEDDLAGLGGVGQREAGRYGRVGGGSRHHVGAGRGVGREDRRGGDAAGVGRRGGDGGAAGEGAAGVAAGGGEFHGGAADRAAVPGHQGLEGCGEGRPHLRALPAAGGDDDGRL